MIKKAAAIALKAMNKKSCHPELVWTKSCCFQLDAGSPKLSIKLGAMFGLDARIALAIFGALSVISGAALYSAIQEAKVTSYHTEMLDLGKAVEAYYLDTGENLPGFNSASAVSYLNLDELYSSSVNGWKGPYVSLSDEDTATEAKIKSGDKVYLVTVATDKAWGGDDTPTDDSANIDCRLATYQCYYWVILENLKTSEVALAERIDEKVDVSVDHENGNYRIRTWGGLAVSTYLKLMPYN